MAVGFEGVLEPVEVLLCLWVTRLCRAEWNQGDTEERGSGNFLTV